MKEYQIEDNEVIIILGDDRIDLKSPMMEDDYDGDIPIIPTPQYIQFAMALVWLIKTDVDFRRWVTDKWSNLVEKWMEPDVEKETE